MPDIPSLFVPRKDAVIDTPEWVLARHEFSFGGVLSALIDVDQIGMTVTRENVQQLAVTGVDMRGRVSAQEPERHPTTSALNGLADVMVRLMRRT